MAKTSDKKTKKTSKKKNFGKTILKVMFLNVIIFIMSATISYGYILGWFDKEDSDIIVVDTLNSVEIEIPRAASTADIAKILEENGVINWPELYKIQSKINGYDGTYRAGTHLVSKENTYEQIMMILSGSPKNMAITIPEGYSFKQIEDLLVARKLINRDRFRKLANSENFGYEFIKKIPNIKGAKYKLEGYLFPDTYFFDSKTPDKDILKSMIDNFDHKIMPAYYSRAKELGMTMHEILTLASLIEKEVRVPEERKIVSGVFHNRLNSSQEHLQKLQSDVTIQYLYVLETGKYKERITFADTKIKDPYNTYINLGLPPGPICMPGLASIEAALYPEEHGYLYFVAIQETGEHKFSKTLQEHNYAVSKYGAGSDD